MCEGTHHDAITKPKLSSLNEIISKLITIPDVDAAALVNADSSIILWRSKNDTKAPEYTDFISTVYQKNIHHFKDGIFVESILKHNGHKILGSKIREDIILLVVLDKRAYIGLTMLNMESCLREMEKVMDAPDFDLPKIPIHINKTSKQPKFQEELH